MIDNNLYMVLATADSEGRPWASPVYYAHEAYRRFIWVSSPDSTHSRNIAARPGVSIVIFDSHVPINTGQAVYMSAVAEELTGDDRQQAVETFSRRSQKHGAGQWTLESVEPPAELRLYAATATKQYVLGEDDRRVEVEL
jgi:nitroimidazol reductase NimA-like FMN-containing flavoprotein (pyridoxamine 5'-phosphate oxidase superfamily)